MFGRIHVSRIKFDNSAATAMPTEMGCHIKLALAATIFDPTSAASMEWHPDQAAPPEASRASMESPRRVSPAPSRGTNRRSPLA